MSSKKKVRVPGQPKLPKDREWIQWGLDHIPRPLSLTEIQNKAAAERLVPARTRITGTVKLVRKTGFFTPRATWEEFDVGLARREETVIEQDGRLRLVLWRTVRSDAKHLILGRIRKLPRRAAFLVFCDLMGPDLRSGKYTRAAAAAKLKIPEHSVVFLLRHRLRLYDMVEPVRRAAGLAYKGGKETSKTEWPPDVVAALLPLTTPTGVLGLIARALNKDGERTAYRILRHLDRAMARPLGREADLGALLFRYGMIVRVPAAIASRERASPPPMMKKKLDVVADVAVSESALPPLPTAPPLPPTLSGPLPAPPVPPTGLPPVPDRTSPAPILPPAGVLCPKCGSLVRVPGGGVPKFCSTCTAPLQ